MDAVLQTHPDLGYPKWMPFEDTRDGSTEWKLLRVMTPDEVIAMNLRDLMEPRDRTRKLVADRLSELLHRNINDWKVMAFEGKRPGRPLKPPSWSELIALATALNATIYDLTLPPHKDKHGVDIVVAPGGADEADDPDSPWMSRDAFIESVFKVPEFTMNVIQNDAEELTHKMNWNEALPDWADKITERLDDLSQQLEQQKPE